MLADLHELALAAGEQGEGRHGLALRAGGDDAHLARRVGVDVVDVDERRVGDLDDPEVAPHPHVLLHAQPERGDDASGGHRGVHDLLDPVEVAGEAGRDDAAIGLLHEQLPQHTADTRLARRVAVLLGVGGVGQEQTDALVRRERADATEVGAPAVDRGEVELEVARVEDDPLRGVQGDRVRVGHGVGDRDELHVERADVTTFAVAALRRVRSGRAGLPPRCGCAPGRGRRRIRRSGSSGRAAGTAAHRRDPRGRG